LKIKEPKIREKSTIIIDEQGNITIWSGNEELLQKLRKLGFSEKKIVQLFGKYIYCG